MLSGLADWLGVRAGAVLTDRISGGGITGRFRMDISVIQPGNPEEVASRLEHRAAALGYQRHEPRAHLFSGQAEHHYRYDGSRELPGLFFSIVPPGCVIDDIIVPAGATGVRVALDPGFTLTEDGRKEFRTPKQSTRSILGGAGVNVLPPPTWQRFWFWWWRRLLERAKLSRVACEIEGCGSQVAEEWFVGGEAVGPYTLGRIWIQRGETSAVTESLGRRCREKAGLQADPAPHRSNAVRAHGKAISVCAIAYGPGETLTSNGATVPAGFVGVLLALTTDRDSRVDLP